MSTPLREDPLFKIGDRVEHAFYGRGWVTLAEWQNIGWTYQVALDEPRVYLLGEDGSEHLEHECVLVESALTPIPVVDQLGDIAR